MGLSQKTVQGDLGELTIATPGDRDGPFEPQLIGKQQPRVPGFDEKILALYAKSMTTRGIQEIVQGLNDVDACNRPRAKRKIAAVPTQIRGLA
jgi:putative transposase